MRSYRSLFSLRAFCTSSFHHQVSLVAPLLPLVTPSTFAATFLMQVAIFFHVLFASSPSSQEPSVITLLLKSSDTASFSFHHFVLTALTCLSHLVRRRKRKSATRACVERQHTLPVLPYNPSMSSYPLFF